MNKNGQITETSPCAACGSPSCMVDERGRPYCVRHAASRPAAVEREGTEKAAALMVEGEE